jgi:hypothetical protein
MLALPFHLREVEVILGVMGGIVGAVSYGARALAFFLRGGGWTWAVGWAAVIASANAMLGVVLVVGASSRQSAVLSGTSAGIAVFLFLLLVLLVLGDFQE